MITFILLLFHFNKSKESEERFVAFIGMREQPFLIQESAGDLPFRQLVLSYMGRAITAATQSDRRMKGRYVYAAGRVSIKVDLLCGQSTGSH